MTHDPHPTPDYPDLARALRRRAQRLGASASDAEDLAQETLLRLMLHIRRQGIAMPRRYAMTILHNLLRARWRQAAQTAPLSEADAPCTAPAAQSRLAVAEVTRAIAALPQDQGQIMVLILQGEVSPRAIADQLGLPPGTVMSRLARARARLRRDIGLARGETVSQLL